MSINAIKKAIESLPEDDYGRLRRWFSDRDWQKWDAQVADDSDSGELDFFLEEAFEEEKAGDLGDTARRLHHRGSV